MRAQERTRLRALDHAVVVGRRHRHHLRHAELGEPRLVDPAQPGGSAIAPVATIQPCPGISRGTDATVPMPPGLVSVMVAPCMSSGDSDPSRVLWIRLLVHLAEGGEVHRVGALDDGHDQRARAVLALHVDGEPEVDVLVHDALRLAVQLARTSGPSRVVAHRDRDRVADQVRERDLHLALRRLQRLVQLAPAAVERVDLEACGSWSRSGSRGSPSCSARAPRRRRAAAQRRCLSRAARPRRRGGRCAVAAVALDVGEHVLLHDLPAGAAAAHLLEIDAVRGGDAARDRRAGRVGRARAVSPSWRRRRQRALSQARLVVLRGCDRGGLLLRGGAVARGRLAGLELRQRLADLDGLVLLGEDLDQLARRGAGTSASTLSVETSTIVSSLSTQSPSCLCQVRIVPSDTDSPIWGIVIWTVSAMF